MLSPIDTLAPRPLRRRKPSRRGSRLRVAAPTTEITQVPVVAQVSTGTVVFSVPSGLGVEVDKDDPSKLIVQPGDYFLDFIVEDDTFKNPALLVLTSFGTAGVEPSGESMATMFNGNRLRKGDPKQTLEFRLNLASGPHDPTIVNTPDPI
jgi:hypothetical protein